MNSLNHQHVLIVGGTSGFGRAVTAKLLEKGARVSIVGRNQARVIATEKEFQQSNGQLSGYTLDADNAEQLSSLMTELPPVDHVISFVGGAMGGGFMDASLDEIRRTIEDKFFVNLQIAKIIGPQISQNGSMIFTGGSGGHPYDASGAIIGNQAISTMTAGLAVELAPTIRVNCVAPTWTPTGLWRDLNEQQKADSEREMAAQIPLGRVAAIDEVADAYMFLLQNNFVTGQTIRVDGGISVN